MSDLTQKLHRLAEAERDVRIASRQLRRQRELIEHLEHEGHETEREFALLLQIQEALQSRIERRNRLRRRMRAGEAARIDPAWLDTPASRPPLVGGP
ncbi:MAG: hypothetical protein AB7P02_28905 [Alphaproteobacteria bacterium]